MNLKRFFTRSEEDSELAAELESHLAHEIDDNLVRGMSAEEARRRAYVKLGNPLRIRDKVWETNRIAWLETTWRDLRYAWRTLAKAPGYTFVALLVMALGIGANTAIYSFLDSLLLRSLPVSDPSSLVILNWHAKATRQDTVMQSMSGYVGDDPRLGSVSDIFPYPAYEIFQKNALPAKDAIFSDVFAYCHTREVRNASVNVNGQAESAKGELVSGDYFHGLQVPPAAGRLILPDDDRVGAVPVVVASHAFAEKHFGSAASAVGQSILINNVAFAVAGVAPTEFFGVDPELVADFYVPLHTNLLLGAGDPFAFSPADYLDRNYYWIQVMARLRPGVSMAQAQAQLAPQFRQWVATTAQNDVQRSNLPVLYLKEGAGGLDTLRRQFSKPLYLLMMLVGLILAIACSNVANLQLVRATSRRREIALRLTEGASRMRVIRQLLTESILLACLGGSLGLLVAIWGIRFLAMLLGDSSSLGTSHAELNWHVAGFTAALSLLTGVLFGLVPALQSTKLDLVTALKETRWQQPRPRHSSPASSGSGFGVASVWASLGSVSLSRVLVAGQIALSLLILVAAGLFVRTLSNLESVNLGFNRQNLLLFTLNGRQSGHRDGEINDFYRDLRERFAAIPGVASAGLSGGSLIGGEDQMPIGLPGAKPDINNRYLTVGPQFLTTMQIPILAGRDIDEHDRTTSQPVAVVNDQFAKINFRGENPLGHHLLLWKEIDGAIVRDMEIVGVAKNASYGNLKRQIPPVIYLPFNQGFPLPNEMMFALRTTGDPLAFVNTVRQIVRQADSRLPISQVRTQQAEIDDQVRQETILAQLCTAFALLALIIACVGLYGTISYTVARRTGEIGIRIALGAQRVPVLWMVLREVLVLATVGLAISVPVALGTSRFVESFMFGIKPNDPLALGFAVIILLLAALLAGAVPARRASQIDPMTALRHE